MALLRSTRMFHSVASSLIRSRRIAAPLSKPYLLRTQPTIRSGDYVGFGPRYGRGYGSGTTGSDGGTSGPGGSRCPQCGQGGGDEDISDWLKKIHLIMHVPAENQTTAAAEQT